MGWVIHNGFITSDNVPLGRLSRLAPNGWSKFYGAARLAILNSKRKTSPLHWHSSKAWKKLSKPSLGAKHLERLQHRGNVPA